MKISRSVTFFLSFAYTLMFSGTVYAQSSLPVDMSNQSLQAFIAAQQAAGNTGGGDSGLSDYVDGLPTKLTLPGGKVIDLTVPRNTVAEDSMNILFSPSSPKPFDTTTLTIVNYATNLSEDRIIWSVNGKIVSDQVGGKTLEVKLGPAGETYAIRVVIYSRSLGRQVAKDITINPADVAILWEADTYTPPFYRGKALPSYRSMVKLIPLPTIIGAGGKRLTPEHLLYTWKQNFLLAPSISGYGKTSGVVEMGTGMQRDTFSLTVKDLDSEATAARTINIDAVAPKIVFYAGTPLQGIQYNRALGNSIKLGTQEAIISAEPYFFANNELGTSDASIRWTQNGTSIPSTGPKTIILRNENIASGRSRIEANLANTKRILERASQTLDISYDTN